MRTDPRRRYRGTALLLVALFAALALSGCRAEAPADEADDDAPGTEARADSRLEPATVRVEITGTHTLSWQGPMDLRIARVGHLGDAVNLLSVGIEAPQKADDPALRFRWAFDLLGVYDDAPGTFTIDTTADAQGLMSMAMLIVMRVVEEARDADAVTEWDDVVFLDQFHVLRAPCTVEIGQGERSGTLVCEQLATDDDKTARLELHWSPPAA